MQTSYDLLLVVVSYAVSVFGSYTALQLAGQITDLRDNLNKIWLVAAAIALGGGAIWSMHFIAMLAYVMPMPVSYDVTLTLASLGVAILVTGIAIYLVTGTEQVPVSRLGGAGLFMGLGVASMHYTGMEAMQMSGATMQHDPMVVGVSVVIAIVASTAALWIALNLRKNWQKIGSAFVMGAAVCGMHYTAMTGVSFSHTGHTVESFASTIFARDLATYIVVATVAVLSLALIAVFSKELRDASQV